MNCHYIRYIQAYIQKFYEYNLCNCGQLWQRLQLSTTRAHVLHVNLKYPSLIYNKMDLKNLKKSTLKNKKIKRLKKQNKKLVLNNIVVTPVESTSKKNVHFKNFQFKSNNEKSFECTPHPITKRIKLNNNTPQVLAFSESSDSNLDDEDIVKFKTNFRNSIRNKRRKSVNKWKTLPNKEKFTTPWSVAEFQSNSKSESEQSDQSTFSCLSIETDPDDSSDEEFTVFDPNNSLKEKILENLMKHNIHSNVVTDVKSDDEDSVDKTIEIISANVNYKPPFNESSYSESELDSEIDDISEIDCPHLTKKSCRIIEPELPNNYLESLSSKDEEKEIVFVNSPNDISFTNNPESEVDSSFQHEDIGYEEPVQEVESLIETENINEISINKDNNSQLNGIKCFILPKYIIYVLKHPTKLYFQGRLNVTVLSGEVEVLGYRLKYNNEHAVDVYSPRGHSHLCFETVEGNRNVSMKSLLKSLEMNEEDIKECCSTDQDSAVIALRKIDSNLVEYLKVHSPEDVFGKMHKRIGNKLFCLAAKYLDVTFAIDPMWRKFKKSDDWDDIVGKISKTKISRTILFGGKSVGKSTMLRYLINKLMLQFGKVVCIDLDFGQPEFTIPSCVYVITVDSPVLGPNYTHVRKPDMSYFVGDINVLNCHTRYLQCVTKLADYCDQNVDKSVPWLINTMGYTKDIALDITAAIIKKISPTLCIQIESKSTRVNFPVVLSSEFILKYKSFLPKNNRNERKLDYFVHVVNSLSENDTKEWEMVPRQARDMVILAYLSQMLRKEKEITAVLPFVCKMSSLKLLSMNCQTENIAAAINANLVALCTIAEADMEQEFPIVSCIGFAVVRGIDEENDDIYLLTPVSEDEIEKVNCLWMGAVTLPPSIYMTSGDHEGHIPYVSFTVPTLTGSVPKTNFRPNYAFLSKE